MPTAPIRSEEELRNIIKAPPGTVTAKINSGPLRASANEFLAAARLGILTTVTEDKAPQIFKAPQVFAVGGAAGFVTQESSDGRLIIPLPADRQDAFAGSRSTAGFAGLLLMVPGVKYTLRVNGAASISDSGESLLLTPDQSYAHCAKAFIRSSLWSADAAPIAMADQTLVNDGSNDHLDDAATAFIESSPFAAIGTSLVRSDADVSPRGDPPGFVQVINRGQLFIPERPGNRIADTLRNLVANATTSVLFMVPGDSRVLEVAGTAVVTTDAELRASTEVNGKTPKLGILVTVTAVTLRHEPAIELGGAWTPASHASESDLPTIGALVADPRGSRSMAKRALTGLTDRAVEFDYKRNLY